MSDDNKNSDPFDFDNFDFDSLKEEEPQAHAGDSAFDLDNPFGDDRVVTPGGDAEVHEEKTSIFDDSSVIESAEESQETNEEGDVPTIVAGEESTPKKKGFLGGLFGGKKAKTPKKEKKAEEKQPKPKKEKKEKVPKDKDTADKPVMPRDWGTILCIAFSVFLLVSLLIFNIGTFLSRGDSLMQTLCFLGAFDIIGLVLVAVPVLFYKFPQERTLPNVMLGISVAAMFTGVLIFVHNYFDYYVFTV